MGGFGYSGRSAAGNASEFLVGPYPNYLNRHLDLTGDGTGASNITGNYAVSTKYWIRPPSGSVYYLTRMIVHVEDAGSFDSGFYGNNITLTNGITMLVKTNGVTNDILDGDAIMTNGDWSHMCHDVSVHDFGQGNNHLTVRWSFFKGHTLIRLEGDKGEYFKVFFQDDFSGLIDHHMMLQGFSANK